MNFRIADTFTDSLATLTGEEQKADRHSEGGCQKSEGWKWAVNRIPICQFIPDFGYNRL